MRDYTETDDAAAGNSGTALESEGNSVATARAEALRNADYASLARRAATDNSRALVNEMLRLIATAETRKRQRGAKAEAAIRLAVERFVGDLLVALAKAQHNEHGAGWVHRSVSPNSFTGAAVSSRTFTAVRAGLVALGLVEEAPGVTQFREAFGKRFVQTRYETRWRATAKLAELAARCGVSLLDIKMHFVPELPKHPLVLKGTSARSWGYKIPGKRMKIIFTDEVKALEQVIIDLNAFLAQFDIRGGIHHGYIREFNCGDHPSFAWNLGGRLYSVGAESYQGLKAAERLKMIIDGQPVCELDIRASALTIFHALRGQPLDFASNPDPYAVGELSATPRELVKAFINATFGTGQLPGRWPQNVSSAYREKTGQSLSREYPIQQVWDAVARAYPLLAELRQDDAEPPIWARLMYLESEAVLRTMLALAEINIPSLSVQDSIIVQRDYERRARDILSDQYKVITGTTPCIVIH
jgi:hypothetical protein